MAKSNNNRIDLFVDGVLAHSWSTSREYAWALVAFAQFDGCDAWGIRITKCGHDRANLELTRDDHAESRPGHPAPVLCPIVGRAIHVRSADFAAPRASR